jgi:short-subunit dehydrogenase
MLTGKVIIITGASSGIGLASVRLWASHGNKLVLAARSLDKLEAAAAEILADPATPPETELLCVKTDVSVEEDCRRMVEQTVARFGGIDILVNNAGVSMRALFMDVDLAVLHRLMDVNFWGTVYCTKYALPYILERKGSVVGVISAAGYAGLPARTGYSASKFAVRGFLDTIRIEHVNDGLHVLVFAPGFTTSNVRRAALTADGTPQGDSPRDESKMMSAEKVARKLERAIERRKREVILTFIAHLELFVQRHLSRHMDRWSYSYMAREPGSPLK